MCGVGKCESPVEYSVDIESSDSVVDRTKLERLSEKERGRKSDRVREQKGT